MINIKTRLDDSQVFEMRFVAVPHTINATKHDVCMKKN